MAHLKLKEKTVLCEASSGVPFLVGHYPLLEDYSLKHIRDPKP